MANLRIKIDATVLRNNLRNPEWLKDIASASLKEIFLSMLKVAKEHAKVDKGELRKKIHLVVIDDFHIALVSEAEHSSPVEHGRRPGTMPPVDVLKKWAKRHGMREEAGWGIAINIKKKGIKESPFMHPALEHGIRIKDRVVKKNFDKIMRYR